MDICKLTEQRYREYFKKIRKKKSGVAHNSEEMIKGINEKY